MFRFPAFCVSVQLKNGSFNEISLMYSGAVVISIALGGAHTCAIIDKGSVKCWGLNSDGQLGAFGSKNFTSVPMSVQGHNSSAVVHI